MKCKTCGKNANSEYCFKCKPRKPLSSGKKPTLSGKKSLSVGISQQMSRISDKNAQTVQNNKQPSEMNQFFMRYWKENKQHTCEVCRVWLGSTPLTYMFDHVLEKSKYPHLAFEEENIMYLCLHCHDKKTRGHYSDVTKERIEYLKNKFKI